MEFSAIFHIIPLVFSFLPCSESLFLNPNNFTNSILSSYDYIIVGGGTAGLVVANRLTEDSSVTVLVLESGQLDSSSNSVTVPGLIGHGLNPVYDWNITTSPQEFLDNQTRPYPQGHVIGGGSVLNGLVVTRGAKADYDAWETLGNPGWGWRDLLPYFLKSETFVFDLDSQLATNLHIQPDLSAHGTKGPLEVAYPRFLYNQSSNFLQGASEVGIPLLNDPNSGISAGAMIVPASISTKNQSRADSRTAYLNGVINRPNLHVAYEQTVTRILIGDKGGLPGITVPEFGHLRLVNGVEFTNSMTNSRMSVNCAKEVILAAGAVLSPVLLQASGIGSSPVLNELGIPIKVDLPGVGQNLQDHGMVSGFYNYTKPGLFSTRNLTGTTLRDAEDEYFAKQTGPWTAPLISTAAFPPLHLLVSNQSSILQKVSSSPEGKYLPPNQHPTILKGYSKQREALVQLLSRDDVGALEIMADSVGTLTVAIHHPFSRGTVRALSADPFANGTIGSNIELNPRYCSQPEDCEILVGGLLLNQQLINTTAMQQLMPNPSPPWDGISRPDLATVNNSLLLDAVRTGLRTEFHPCGTTSMMPYELGGVVNPRLMVYGMANLRVVDAGIIPLIPAAHLQAAVYAIAEKAADLIKEDHTPPERTPPVSSGPPFHGGGSPRRPLGKFTSRRSD